jgi:TonB family protein
MPMRFGFAMLITNGILLSACAQSPGPNSLAKIVKLTPPNYPPIARVAHVTGEVHLEIKLSNHGSVEDIQVMDGPVMLREAAVNSAKTSQFELEGTQNDRTSYALAYNFVVDATACGEANDPSYPHVSYEPGTVTIAEKVVPLCDPGADIKVRSAKCLFLWKCGWKTP